MLGLSSEECVKDLDKERQSDFSGLGIRRPNPAAFPGMEIQATNAPGRKFSHQGI